MKKYLTIALVWLALVIGILSCKNMTKEVKIELPDYSRQLVVECYMEVGKPFRLLVTESVGFFEGADTPVVTGAKVVISHGNVHDTLPESFSFDPVGFKIFNFTSSNLVPRDYTTEYSLQVIDIDGRKVTGTAKVVPRVNMSDMTFSYNADSAASLTMHWPDFPNQADYYRLTLHKGTLYTGNPDSSSEEFDFTLDDRIGDGQTFTIGTLFSYHKGDTLISTVYHISEAYWRYINSIGDAQSSNGNPFAQPGVIHSTVTGGLGAFTGYDYDRDTVIVP